MRNLFALIAGLVWFGMAAAAPVPAAAAYLLLLDDQVVAARRADQALPPASLSKLMTARLWLRQPERAGEVVTVSARAAKATGTRLGIVAGERYLARDLLVAMLVGSTNDACLALAEHAGGSVERFVGEMNREAAALGLAETRFANPCGHDDPGQRSSARDLAQLTRVLWENAEFRTIVGLGEARIAALGGRRERTLRTSNQLIGRLDGTRGVKTGYTPNAGKCLIAWVERAGHRVLLVLLDAPDRWWTAHRMVERAFAAADAR